MLYGISISAAGPGGDPAAMAELAAEAEQAGWDGIFLEDYIVYQGQAGMATYDPWVTMAAMAVATSRVRLGTSVTPLPRRRSWGCGPIWARVRSASRSASALNPRRTWLPASLAG
jgi:alkanesulfonate monooxygenase SsuD/methylene tetrahydromethanopterin reductase-like flavin-dependent oxidoreductase (luciferase family)